MCSFCQQYSCRDTYFTLSLAASENWTAQSFSFSSLITPLAASIPLQFITMRRVLIEKWVWKLLAQYTILLSFYNNFYRNQ